MFVKCLSTGCASLDDILGGGILTCEITELVGGFSSGKTQLCLTTLATLLLDNDTVHAVYIDTCNCFNAMRFREILLGRLHSNSNIVKNEEDTILLAEQCMRRVKVIRVFEPSMLWSSISRIIDNEEKRTGSQTGALRLVVLDSITSIFAGSVGGTGKFSSTAQAFVAISHTATMLRHLAEHINTAVLVTNSTVHEKMLGNTWSGNAVTSKPALGHAWNKEPNIRLSLSKVDDRCLKSLTDSLTFHARVTKSCRGSLSRSAVMCNIGTFGVSSVCLD